MPPIHTRTQCHTNTITIWFDSSADKLFEGFFIGVDIQFYFLIVRSVCFVSHTLQTYSNNMQCEQNISLPKESPRKMKYNHKTEDVIHRMPFTDDSHCRNRQIFVRPRKGSKSYNLHTDGIQHASNSFAHRKLPHFNTFIIRFYPMLHRTHQICKKVDATSKHGILVTKKLFIHGAQMSSRLSLKLFTLISDSIAEVCRFVLLYI